LRFKKVANLRTMPYRRLPNTDLARLRALQKALEKASVASFNDQFIPYKILSEAQRFYAQFKTTVSQKNDTHETRVNANKQYRHEKEKARMYISHFIQVLNLAVVRGEIKKQQKELYGLDPNIHVVPDLSGDEDILVWGKRIIEGEQKRISEGGYPIYNPTINKVQVFYNMFKSHQQSHTFHENNTDRMYTSVDNMRAEADRIIVDIWNTVEEHYKDLLPYEKMQHCKDYGIVYYYRPNEQHYSTETDEIMRKAREAQTALQF